MEEPVIEFSRWRRWAERGNLKGSDRPGVYILARYPNPTNVPSTLANSQAKEVLYIGETCNQSLKRRWYQFDRSADLGNGNHSGGNTYHSKIGDNRDTLYVAVFPIFLPDKPKRDTFIRYVERKLLWNYVCIWNSLPTCNGK